LVNSLVNLVIQPNPTSSGEVVIANVISVQTETFQDAKYHSLQTDWFDSESGSASKPYSNLFLLRCFTKFQNLLNPCIQLQR
jgi:hypothetical protein